MDSRTQTTTQSSSQWMLFAGGLVLGGSIAAGGALVAMKYLQWKDLSGRQEYSQQSGYRGGIEEGNRKVGGYKKRPPRAPSPQSRQLVGRRHGSGPQLLRQDTDLYYENAHQSMGVKVNGETQETLKNHRESTQSVPGLMSSSMVGKRHQRGVNRSATYPDVSGDQYATENENPRIYMSPENPSESEGVAGDGIRRAIYAGPADRSNPALQEAIRHTVSHPHAQPSSGGTPTSKINPFGSMNVMEASGSANMGRMHHSQLGSNGGQHHHQNSNAGKSQHESQYHGPPQSKQTTHDVLASEGRIIEDAALHEHYSRVITPNMPQTEETDEVCHMLKHAIEERKKWVFKPSKGPEDLMHEPEAQFMKDCFNGNPFHWDDMDTAPYRFRMVDGVVHVWNPDFPEARLFAPPGSASEFFSTMLWLLKISALGTVRTFTHHRMQLLEQKFNLHVMLNADKEFLAQKSAPHRDFYNVRKVDTHVHHSACMHQKHLLRFIKSKLKKEPDELVIFRDGKFLTLKEVFESLNLTPYDLSVDTLDVHADKNIFHRFDKFNLKYNPFGQSRLREIFIKQENIIHGRFLAELTREVFNDLEASKYQHTEYRISIYGRKPVEWDTLAAWVVQNRLYSDNNMWMIQIPRLYNVYKHQGIIENFQQFLDNIFLPMYEATINPKAHPMLHIFLKHISGFDLVDDESKPEKKPSKDMPIPEDWNTKHNPPYAYYTYYMYANLYTLNRLRESRGLNTFSLRPHCGEAGDLDHLAATFLLAENIAHGINLRKSPCLQYLYYVTQIGLCMSPLSNNSLFLDYHRNPFPQFFARGLSVSLSTDDPLQIHLTREPLVEEYSVAAQVWKLSATDLCEIARNSVIHSGFPHRLKMHWVHTEYWKDGPEGNNIQKTNVPALRMVFRKDCLTEERGILVSGALAHESRLQAKEQYD